MTAEQLHEMFEYKDGMLFVKKPLPHSKMEAGDRAGGASKNGYRCLRIQNKVYLEHRLVYLMFHGSLPRFVDHINGNRCDNRIENLRPCTLQENQRNKKLSKANKSGYKGVSWRASAQKWRVAIRVDGRRLEIGAFKDLELAGLVADMAREKYHGNFCRHD